MIVSWFKIRRP